jgi:hypothetical protein
LGLGERQKALEFYNQALTISGIAATGTAAHVRALGCLPSKNMGALAPNYKQKQCDNIVSPAFFVQWAIATSCPG